jgi:hypothetical protein
MPCAIGDGPNPDSKVLASKRWPIAPSPAAPARSEARLLRSLSHPGCSAGRDETCMACPSLSSTSSVIHSQVPVLQPQISANESYTSWICEAFDHALAGVFLPDTCRCAASRIYQGSRLSRTDCGSGMSFRVSVRKNKAINDYPVARIECKVDSRPASRARPAPIPPIILKWRTPGENPFFEAVAICLSSGS